MFVNAIEKVGGFTRPLLYISRTYKSTVVHPGSLTMFFVNEEGCAVTNRATAEVILSSQNTNAKYNAFKQSKAQLKTEGTLKAPVLKRLEAEYGYKEGSVVNLKCHFVGCVAPIKEITCHVSKKYDLAIIKFKDYEQTAYNGFAVFPAEGSEAKPGKFLCRLGYPFPEFSNFIYNGLNDDIEWGDLRNISAPRFPLEGMLTRNLMGDEGLFGFEMSNTVFRGQCGGPVFDEDGTVHGMIFNTRNLNTGFEVSTNMGKKECLYPVSHCINAKTIKEFLRSNNVKYYEK